jgi:hypothetical protein
MMETIVVGFAAPRTVVAQSKRYWDELADLQCQLDRRGSVGASERGSLESTIISLLQQTSTPVLVVPG